MTLFTLRTAAIAALWIALSMLGSPPTTAGGVVGRILGGVVFVGLAKLAYLKATSNEARPADAA